MLINFVDARTLGFDIYMSQKPDNVSLKVFFENNAEIVAKHSTGETEVKRFWNSAFSKLVAQRDVKVRYCTSIYIEFLK